MSRYLKSQQKLIDSAFADAVVQRRLPASRVATKRKARKVALPRAKA
jgi:hypothetical protein